MKEYKEWQRFGPGGSRCSCCNPYQGSRMHRKGRKETKQKVNRAHRRAAKQNLEKE